jgi:hypothetical protein
MTKLFVADITDSNNDAVLVYSEAFKELYKTDKDRAMKQMSGILGDDKEAGNYFSLASNEARAKAVENIVGVASTLGELKALRQSFDKAFKTHPREQPVNRIVHGRATFYAEVTKALNAKIAPLENAVKKAPDSRKR